MLARMFTTMESLPEEKEEETTSEGTEADSEKDVDESTDSGISTNPSIQSPPSPANIRSGKARKTKDRTPFYKGFSKGEGVVYLPGDINGLAKKLQLLATDFFADNTAVRNELVHVLDALLRLKQLTPKEYTNITARVAA